MSENPDDDSTETPQPTPPADDVSGDYQTLANGFLTPRHRRFAQLAAEGLSQKQIGEELGYVPSRVSVLLRHPLIAQEIVRLQDRLFEETIQTRLKAMADPALSNIEAILKDRTNRVKMSEKFAASTWVVEKLDGKATQKTDIGDNLLGVLLDRLDARKANQPEPREVGPADGTIETRALPAPPSTQEEDELESWVRDFNQKSD